MIAELAEPRINANVPSLVPRSHWCINIQKQAPESARTLSSFGGGSRSGDETTQRQRLLLAKTRVKFLKNIRIGLK